MDFTQSMDNGYMIPTSVAVGSGEATDIRCVCDTVEDFKTFLDTTDMELRYEGLVTYEKVNKLLKVYKGNNEWQVVGEGGGGVDTSSFITLTQLSQQLSNYYTKTQTDNKISEEIAKAQLGGDNEVDLSVYATKNYVDNETSILNESKFDDISLNGNNLQLKANGNTKKTIVLPLEGASNECQNLSNSTIAKGTNGYNSKPIRPIISFTDDDGKAGVYSKWKPILEEKEIPLNVCIITDSVGKSGYMSWDEIRDLQNNHNCEILSHTVSHKNIGVHETNKTWIEELKQSKLTLIQNGLDVRGIAYPNGGFWGTKEGLVHGTTNGLWMSGLFYDYGIITDGLINTTPIKHGNMGISRVGIGSYETTGCETLEGMKAKVDECIANNGWLVFMTHIDDVGHTDEDTENIKLLIDYIKEKQVDIVTLSEGFEIFGNIIETPKTKITKQGDAIIDVTSKVPNATKDNLGIVQIGEGISVSDGIISVDGSMYYSKEYIDNYLDSFESRISNLENNQGNGGGSANNPPAISSISSIKASPNASFDIVYTAVDSDGIQIHELSADNGIEYNTINPVEDGNNFTYSMSISEEGIYYCKLRVTDTLGNSSVKSFTIIIETKKIIPDKVTTQGGCVIESEGVYLLTDTSSYDNFMWYDTQNRLSDTSKTYKLCIKTLEKNIIDTPSLQFGKSWIMQNITMPTLDELIVGDVIKKEFTIKQEFTSSERILFVQFAQNGTLSTLKIQMWIEV